MSLFIGLMSGTSMDGIDAAVVDAATHTLVCAITKPYSSQVRQMLQDCDNKGLAYYAQLNTLLGREFGQAVIELLTTHRVNPADITAIGSHGQTLCHNTNETISYTVQLGCAHTIAEMTGITVVADFRTRDIVNGGQGAPFAPLYHQVLFKDKALPLAIVNIGGIANITTLTTLQTVSGYDSGPGNCLMDAWISQNLGRFYDEKGAWAKSGQVIPVLLKALLADDYFHQRPPKSIGKEYFSLNWLLNYIKKDYSPCDVQATLLQLTAITIADGVKSLSSCPPQVLICGGGVHNQALLNTLSEKLPDILVRSTQELNIDPDFIEAQLFAWLAERAINNKPLQLASITGAKRQAVLGVIYPRGIDKGNSLAV